MRLSAVLLLSAATVSGTPAVAEAQIPPDSFPGWHELDPGPLSPRLGQTQVWTGEEMIVWGGRKPESRGNMGLLGDGAAYSPAAGRWRRVPRGPLRPRAAHLAVWIGDRMLVWGGDQRGKVSFRFSDGATYDPRTDQWRMISTSPLHENTGYAAVWTGKEVVFWGGLGSSVSRTGGQQPNPRFNEGAAYDPEHDSWRQIPVAGLDLSFVDAVWTGREVIVFGGAELNTNVAIGFRGPLLGAAYDPARDSWRSLPPVDLSMQAATGVWDGTRFIAWNSQDRKAVGFDPVVAAWSSLPDPPDIQNCGDIPRGVATSFGVFAVVCRGAAVLSRDLTAWSLPPPPPLKYTKDGIPLGPWTKTLLWTRREVLIWGTSGSFRRYREGDFGTAFWAYVPEP